MLFHHVLDLLDAAGWQVRQHLDRLEVLVAAPTAAYDQTQAERAIRAALTLAGVAPMRVDVTTVQTIPPARRGKRPLVMAHPLAATGLGPVAAEHIGENGRAEPGDP